MLGVTSLYIDPATKSSRIATIPNESQEKIAHQLQRSQRTVPSFVKLLDMMLDHASMTLPRWLTHLPDNIAAALSEIQGRDMLA